jgi:hypothetical protein
MLERFCCHAPLPWEEVTKAADKVDPSQKFIMISPAFWRGTAAKLRSLRRRSPRQQIR